MNILNTLAKISIISFLLFNIFISCFIKRSNNTDNTDNTNNTNNINNNIQIENFVELQAYEGFTYKQNINSFKHSFKINLLQDQFFALKIGKENVDIEVQILDAEYKQITKLVHNDIDIMYFVADKTSSFYIIFNVMAYKINRSKLDLQIASLKTASLSDRNIYNIQKKLDEALLIYSQRQGKKEKYPIIRNLCHEAKNIIMPNGTSNLSDEEAGLATQILILLADMDEDEEQREKALDQYKQAQTLCPKNKFYVQAIIYNDIGYIYRRLINIDLAISNFESAKESIGQLPFLFFPVELEIYHNTASIYAMVDDVRESLSYFHKVIDLVEEEMAKQDVQTSLERKKEVFHSLRLIYSNLGYLYYKIGMFDKTHDYYNKSLDLASKHIPKIDFDPILQAALTTQIAQANISEGNLKDVDRHLLDAQKQLGNKPSTFLCSNLSQLGRYYVQINDFEKAKTYFKEVIKTYDEALKNHTYLQPTSLIEAINGLGNIYFLQGNFDEALKYYQQSVNESKKLGLVSAQAKGLHFISYILLEQNNIIKAKEHIEECIELLEKTRNSIPDPDLRTSFFNIYRDPYELNIEILSRLASSTNLKKYSIEAFQKSEKLRSRNLREYLTESLTNIKAHIPEIIKDKEQTLLKNIILQEKSASILTQELNKPENQENHDLEPIKEKLQRANEKIQTLYGQLEEIKVKLKQANPVYADIKYPEPASLKTIQSSLLDEDSILVEYLLSKKDIYIWTITRESFNSYVIKKKDNKGDFSENLNEAIKILASSQNNLINPKFTDISLKLSNKLIKPISDELKKLRKHKILIVADGLLHKFPLSVLPVFCNEGDDCKVLLESYEIIYLPSATTSLIIRERANERKNALNKALVVADPVFSLSDERISGLKISPNTNPTPDPQSLDQQVAQLLIPTQKDPLEQEIRAGKLKRLKYSANEATVLHDLLGANARILLGFDANLNNVLNSIDQYDFIHFATHGVVDDTHPNLSAIVFSYLDKDRKPQVPNLRAYNLFDINLNARLVVLSACRTGLGKEVTGDGIFGLTRGFFYAGATSMVVSLWTIDDATTAELMNIFYNKIFKEGKSPSESLRLAQLEIMKKKGVSNYYYWAAFSFQGDWQWAH